MSHYGMEDEFEAVNNPDMQWLLDYAKAFFQDAKRRLDAKEAEISDAMNKRQSKYFHELLDNLQREKDALKIEVVFWKQAARRVQRAEQRYDELVDEAYQRGLNEQAEMIGLGAQKAAGQ